MLDISVRQAHKGPMVYASSGLQSAAPQPQNTFLLVQEIVDEENYNRLSDNLQSMHTLCLGGSDKVRLIFTDEAPAALSSKVFKGVAPTSRAMLVLLSDCGFSPKSIATLAPGMALQPN